MKTILKSLIICGLALSPAISAAQPYPYQDPNLSPEERAADLCSRMTIEEKARILTNGSDAIERVGITQYNWWNEALHGIGRNGVATVFPSCIGMACSFDDDLIEAVFSATSDEGRAKNTMVRRQGLTPKQYQFLTFWTPNINIFRDPRWGRGQETYGEDPYMTGRMGVRVVRGLQGDGTDKYYKLLACAKHYAVHSGPERTRHNMDINELSERDLWETYLPAFKDLVIKGDVRQVMCAYQRFEGEPCCGSNRLLNRILREKWGYTGVVVSDCGAIADFWVPNHHMVTSDRESAAAKGVIAGTDLECGGEYRSLPEAVRRGLVSEDEVDVSVRRVLAGRFSVGNFDPDSLVSWTRISPEVIASPEHKALALQMAREQMVLLKNNGILPLAKDASRVIVMGPNAADSLMLWGIYNGTPTESVTILDGIRRKVGDVAYNKTCGVTYKTGGPALTPAEAVAAAEGKDVVIFVGGISQAVEREEDGAINEPGFDHGDRTSIELPLVQRDIVRALHDAGKKVVFVNCSGSAIGLTPENEICDAILQAWYPGEQGGTAVADVLFGDYNPQGKLCVTFYRDDSQLPDFEDYNMAGRTYRYFHGSPLYPFGHGLSYTSYRYGKPKYKKGQLKVDVKNTGKVDGTEIVEVYIRRPSDVDGPIKTLRGYERVELKAGEKKTVTIDMPQEAFEVWDEAAGEMRVIPGEYEIMVGPSSADFQTIKVKI